MPDREQLEKIRRASIKDGKSLRKAIAAPAFKDSFGEVRGDVNKVLPEEFKSAAKSEPLVANKQFFVAAKLPVSAITSPS